MRSSLVHKPFAHVKWLGIGLLLRHASHEEFNSNLFMAILDLLDNISKFTSRIASSFFFLLIILICMLNIWCMINVDSTLYILQSIKLLFMSI